MTVAEVLRRLEPTEPAPSIAHLGGEVELLHDVAKLDADLVPRLIEAITQDWAAVEQRESMGLALVSRLCEVRGVTSFATSLDSLLIATVASQSEEMARVLMKALLETIAQAGTDAERALRAGHAVRAAVDLALLDIGVTAHGVLATIEDLRQVPPEMASGLARAVGRLWEHYDEMFLEGVLEQRVVPHDDAAADASVELGLKALRDAFSAHTNVEAAEALRRGDTFFERARAFDEDRPDARAYQAAARCVLGFGSSGDELSAALDDLTLARGDLDRYTFTVGEPFRGAAPLRSVAAWHVLAATLRELRAHLQQPVILDLRPAVEALAEAYEGVRLGVLEDERLGLRAFIRPIIATSVAHHDVLAQGVAELASEPNSTPGARELASEVVRPKAGRQMAKRSPRF